jgi:type VI secretion system protein ImpK
MKAAKAAKAAKSATGTRTGMFQGTREMLRSAIAAKPPKSSGLGGALKKVNDIVRPCLITVTQLHALKRERKPPPEMAYQNVRNLLSSTVRKLEGIGLPPEDVQDIRYALVAFVDELMQADPGPLREFWVSHLLQLEFFGETRAGEGFFERLEKLKSARKGPALRVYYLCLLFGFHGIYGQHGELERENLIVGVQSSLSDCGGLVGEPNLSPHGHRPDEPGIDRERNRLLQFLAVAAAVMAVVWYVGLVFTVDAQEHTLNEILQNSYEDLKAGLSGSDYQGH